MIDRRTFLASAAAGAAGLIAAACGSTASSSQGATTSTSATEALSAATARRRGSLAHGAPRTLAQAIRGRVLVPGNPGYTTAAHVYNERFDGVRPSAVAFPTDAADVQAAIRYTVAHAVPIRAKSGGHSYAGYSTLSGGVVLDLSNLNHISVDHRAGTATVGAGSQLLNVYSALAAHGATIPAGSCPSVGVGGHALGGGMGLAGRHLGLASDSIAAVQIVTADGQLRTVSPSSNPDLFWALRGGGGGNFGVVTQFTFHLHPLPASAAYFFVSWPWSSASEAIDAWINWAPHTTALATSILHLNGGSGGTSIDVTGQYFGSASALASVLAPLRAVPGAQITTGNQSYLGLMLRWAGCLSTPIAECHTVGTAPHGTLPRASFDAKSDYVTKPFSAAGRATLVSAVERRASQPGSGAILFDSYGGRINQISPSATAFVHRDSLACIQYLTYNGGEQWLTSSYRSMRPYVSGYAYQNYIDHSLANWQHAYYGANYARLEQIRRAVDPHHYFTFPQAIGR